MGVKISELPDATLPLDGTEELPVVQSGTTVKVPVADLGLLRALTFTTNGSGAATVAATIGKTVYLFEYATGGAGTLLGTSLYTFNSGTGAFSGLSPSTPYLVFYE